MPSDRVRPDQWAELVVGGMRIFIRRDSLMDPDYWPRVDWGIDSRTGWGEVRWSSTPAGGRLQFAFDLRRPEPEPDDFEPMNTDQFRVAELEQERFETRRAVPSGVVVARDGDHACDNCGRTIRRGHAYRQLPGVNEYAHVHCPDTEESY